jgi:hypothetical protein
MTPPRSDNGVDRLLHIPRVQSQAAVGRAALRFPHSKILDRCMINTSVETSGPVQLERATFTSMHSYASCVLLHLCTMMFQSYICQDDHQQPPPYYRSLNSFLWTIFNSGTAALQTQSLKAFFVPRRSPTLLLSTHAPTPTPTPTPTQPTHPHTFHSHSQKVSSALVHALGGCAGVWVCGCGCGTRSSVCLSVCLSVFPLGSDTPAHTTCQAGQYNPPTTTTTTKQPPTRTRDDPITHLCVMRASSTVPVAPIPAPTTLSTPFPSHRFRCLETYSRSDKKPTARALDGSHTSQLPHPHPGTRVLVPVWHMFGDASWQGY